MPHKFYCTKHAFTNGKCCPDGTIDRDCPGMAELKDRLRDAEAAKIYVRRVKANGYFLAAFSVAMFVMASALFLYTAEKQQAHYDLVNQEQLP